MAYPRLGQIKFLRKIARPFNIEIPKVSLPQVSQVVQALIPQPGEPQQSFLSRVIRAATVAFPTEADRAYTWAREQAGRYGMDLTSQKWREATSNPFMWVAVAGAGVLGVLLLTGRRKT